MLPLSQKNNFHYCVLSHRSLFNLEHVPTTLYLNIHFNVILSSTPLSLKWSNYLGVSGYNFVIQLTSINLQVLSAKSSTFIPKYKVQRIIFFFVGMLRKFGSKHPAVDNE